MGIINRYANRKCYSTNHRKFVTFKEIFDMIGNGEEIKIIDYSTKDDITSRVLGKLVNYKNLNSDDLTSILRYEE